jgi:UTP--glucose-1-phosphate uridylyltransferase
VPWEEVNRYGVASVEATEDDAIVKVTGLVEKPAREVAPSNLAVVGRYVLPNTIFDAIRRTKPGSGGEIQLTDAMALLLAEGTPVHGIVYRGVRFDTGMPLGYLQAVVELACRRPDLGPAFREWLTDFVAADKNTGRRGVEQGS